MNWFTRKLDSLAGAVFAGVFGASASQFDIFVQQYLQRLGGHADEAQRNLTAIVEGERYRDFAPAARQVLLDDARGRVEELQAALQALSDSELLMRPFTFIAHLDREIVARTFEQFRPALPLDLAGIVFAVYGVVVGLIVYELLKAPIALALWRHRRHRTIV
jgi:hypothetical protein